MLPSGAVGEAAGGNTTPPAANGDEGEIASAPSAVVAVNGAAPPLPPDAAGDAAGGDASPPYPAGDEGEITEADALTLVVQAVFSSAQGHNVSDFSAKLAIRRPILTGDGAWRAAQRIVDVAGRLFVSAGSPDVSTRSDMRVLPWLDLGASLEGADVVRHAIRAKCGDEKRAELEKAARRAVNAAFSQRFAELRRRSLRLPAEEEEAEAAAPEEEAEEKKGLVVAAA